MDAVEICNEALQRIGTRTAIASLSENSAEAINCNRIYNSLRDRVNRMARWNWCKQLSAAQLLKAAPGTPENPTAQSSVWSPEYPPVPWLYEYRYPNACLQLQAVIPQSPNPTGTVPIFPTTGFYTNPWSAYPVKFEVQIDTQVELDITGITRADPAVVTSTAHGLTTGDRVTLTEVEGMTEVNNQTYIIEVLTANTFELHDLSDANVNSTNYTAYTSGGLILASPQRVIVTDAPSALIWTNIQVTDLNLWDNIATNALSAAIAARLAIALSGDKALARACYEEANAAIIEARAVDGNEGFIMQNIDPDWLTIRDTGPGTRVLPYWAPYPPLFVIPGA